MTKKFKSLPTAMLAGRDAIRLANIAPLPRDPFQTTPTWKTLSTAQKKESRKCFTNLISTQLNFWAFYLANEVDDLADSSDHGDYNLEAA